MNRLLAPNNHLLTLAHSGQRLPHWLLAILLSFAFALGAQICGGVPAVLLVLALSYFGGEMGLAGETETTQEVMERLALPNTALEQLIYLVLAFAPIFFFLWLWLRLFEKRPLWSIGLEAKHAAPNYLRGLLIGLLMFTASVGVAAALGYMALEQGPSQGQGLPALGGVLLLFLGWTVQGPAEEALTRGWLLPVLGARYTPLLGVLLSSVAFAAYHLPNPNLSLIAILNLFLFGVFAALFALYEGGLWGVFSIHAIWNWAQGNLFGLAVSGNPQVGGTIFNLQEVGPDFITGGPFGPEGGLAVTAVLLISCALVIALSARQAGRPDTSA
jgi:hypothetical protein